MTYLNTAYMGPRLKAVHEAGLHGLERSANPWSIKADDFFTDVEEARALFAQLLSVSPENIALVPSASYGIETAARNLKAGAGEHILVLEGQFPSNIYPWQRMAQKMGAEIRTVPAPKDGDWTQAVLAHMEDSVAIATLPHCHWTNGARLDLTAISGACDAHGTALVLDVTQSLGAMPLNMDAVRPDFLVAATYKWLLGPYSMGFLYIGDSHLNGAPLEENWVNRDAAEDFARLVNYRDTYRPGARRFDFGERSNPILVPMAIAALRQLNAWGVDNIAQRLERMTDKIADVAQALGYKTTAKAFRSPHFLGLEREGGLDSDLAERLAAENIHVSIRGNSIRVSPHLHVSDNDISRFLSVL